MSLKEVVRRSEYPFKCLQNLNNTLATLQT